MSECVCTRRSGTSLVVVPAATALYGNHWYCEVVMSGEDAPRPVSRESYSTKNKKQTIKQTNKREYKKQTNKQTNKREY
jgi:hypothetical protein